MNRAPYVPKVTREKPLLAASRYAPGVGVHAWFEALNREGRPVGSRALCGKRSTGWCVEWDGFTFEDAGAINDAKSFFGASLCVDCESRLPEQVAS